MLFSIAVCAQDPGLRAGLQRHCQDYFARRADSCLVEPLEDPQALLDRDAQNARYQLYLIELAGQPCGTALPAGLEAAMELRRRGPPDAPGLSGPDPGLGLLRLPGRRHSVSPLPAQV